MKTNSVHLLYLSSVPYFGSRIESSSLSLLAIFFAISVFWYSFLFRFSSSISGVINFCFAFKNCNNFLYSEQQDGYGVTLTLIKGYFFSEDVLMCQIANFKVMFSKKATKIDEIFTVDLTLCSKCQINGEDFVIFCDLLRKQELYCPYVLKNVQKQ